MVAILSTLGIISNLSNSFLGLSILAWGNSIGDLISNIALARQGYAKMSFAACFGGPMFSKLYLKHKLLYMYAIYLLNILLYRYFTWHGNCI